AFEPGSSRQGPERFAIEHQVRSRQRQIPHGISYGSCQVERGLKFPFGGYADFERRKRRSHRTVPKSCMEIQLRILAFKADNSVRTEGLILQGHNRILQKQAGAVDLRGRL